MKMANVANVGVLNPDYLMSNRGLSSRWLLLTQRMHDTKEASGPRFGIEKSRVLSFGDGFVEVKPEYFHPSQNNITPTKIFVTEMAHEIQILLDS